jgi:hypothetical protein
MNSAWMDVIVCLFVILIGSTQVVAHQRRPYLRERLLAQTGRRRH